MNEYGKLIDIEFKADDPLGTGDLSLDSIETFKAQNINALTVTANEYNYVPDGQLVQTSYSVEDIDLKRKKIRKRDFDEGVLTNLSKLEGMTLAATYPYDGEIVGYTSYSTTSDTSTAYGHLINVQQGSYKLNSVKVYLEEYGKTLTCSLHHVDTSNGDYVTNASTRKAQKSFTISSSDDYQYYTLDLSDKPFILTPGVWWFGLEGDYYMDMRYRTNASYPQQNSNQQLAIIGYKKYTDTTLSTGYWYHFYSYSFQQVQYISAGQWGCVIDCSGLFDVDTTVFDWSEITDSETDIQAFVALSDSAETEPTNWIIQSPSQAISVVQQSDDLTGKYLWVKFELTTVNTDKTPTLSGFDILLVNQVERNHLVLLVSKPGYGTALNNVVGDITVSYDSTIGGLMARVGNKQIESFTKTFNATELRPKNHPNAIENIDLISVNMIAQIGKTNRIGMFQGDENIELTDVIVTTAIYDINNIPT